MPSFKPKANRKIINNSKTNVTVDGKHREMMIEFQDISNNIIPKLKKKRDGIRDKLKNSIGLTIDDEIALNDDMISIKLEIREMRSKKKKYLLDNVGHVFDYFEKKNDLTKDVNKTTVLHSFFNKPELKKMEGKIEGFNSIQQYLTNMDESLIDINDYIIVDEKCMERECGGELISVEHEGVRICDRCGVQKPFLIAHEKPSYKEPPKEVCFYAYKRINHFREILAQFQAKETTQIPAEVLNNIILQIKKERITVKDITNKKAKDILKKLGYNKYYEHIPFIKDKLGIKPPIMSQELEDKLCSLFMDIQRPYAQHCPDDRVNFLNYYYVLYKICELLGETRFLPFFPMLKDPVKRIEQDEIWKKICGELRWEYVETI
jgi:hypothetical protein